MPNKRSSVCKLEVDHAAFSGGRRVQALVAVLALSWSMLGPSAGAGTATAASDGRATPGTPPAAQPTRTSELLHKDVLINADMWAARPQMLAAGLGFTNIVGVPGLNIDDLALSESQVRAAGGTWNRVSCARGEAPPLSAYTSASSPKQVALSFGFPESYLSGLPVEFSWPVRPSTLSASDFRVTLNDGRSVAPAQASIYPNAQYDERSTVVLFGTFGNRLPQQNPMSVYPVRTSIVATRRPLQLVGPHSRLVSAVGLSATSTTTPYDDPGQHTGPRLVAAKLSRMSTLGERAPAPFAATLPNDGVALYGRAAHFRLRLYTSGGFSPDGVRAVFPTEFSRYFRLRARGRHGRTVMLTRTGVDYHLGGGVVRVLGLANLGRKQSHYDDCYQEDKDNQIDIVLGGDARAARRLDAVEIPASGRYSPFYNPGGHGNDPTPGVRYTAPGPAQVQPVMDAIGNPMTVTFVRRSRPSR